MDKETAALLGTHHLVDWRQSPSDETSIFYIMNSQECSLVKFEEENSNTALNIVWGIVFLVLGVCTVILNVAAIRGLYSSTSRTGDLFRPVVYVNVSVLDIMGGVCALMSGGILLSNFTWDESDGGGKFICNLFGIVLTLVVQTKIMLIAGGLLITVLTVVMGVKMQHQIAVRMAAVIVLLSWVVGIIHAFLPYMYGSVYTQPDYLSICIGSFSGMSYDKTGSYYSGQLIMLFIPLLLGLLLCLFTIPGMIVAKRTMQVYKWEDEFWGVFTMTSLFMSYLVCHATYYIIHFSGMSELDGRRSINFCQLTLFDMRYFFAFMAFTIYIAGIAEPLSYMTTNMEVRDKLCAGFPGTECEALTPATSNRVTPLLVDIRDREKRTLPVPGKGDSVEQEISHI